MPVVPFSHRDSLRRGGQWLIKPVVVTSAAGLILTAHPGESRDPYGGSSDCEVVLAGSAWVPAFAGRSGVLHDVQELCLGQRLVEADLQGLLAGLVAMGFQGGAVRVGEGA